MTEADTIIITEGNQLVDCHFNFAQQLIRNQFLAVQGLRNIVAQKNIKNEKSKNAPV